MIPAIPQFTLKIDQDQVVITIKNQPISGETIYYNARAKLHTDTGWTNAFYIDDAIGTFNCPQQSTSDFTIISSSVPSYAVNSQIDIQVKAVPQYSTQVFVPDHAFDPYGFFKDDGHYESRMVIGTASAWSNTQTILVNQPSSPTPFPSIVPPWPTATPYQNQPSQTSPTTSPTTISPQTSVPPGAPAGLSWTEIALIIMAVVIAGLVVAQVLLWRRIKIK